MISTGSFAGFFYLVLTGYAFADVSDCGVIVAQRNSSLTGNAGSRLSRLCPFDLPACHNNPDTAEHCPCNPLR